LPLTCAWIGRIMTETAWGTLRRRLVERYDDLRILLTRRLGSDELARETLHETWLRLDRIDDIAVMRNPDGYLARVVWNLATDRQRLETRLAHRSDVNAVLDELIDERPNQADWLEARRDLAPLQQALGELPERRRAILIAARLDEEPHQKIADRYGISKRMVQIELKYALNIAETALTKSRTQPFALAAGKRHSREVANDRGWKSIGVSDMSAP